MYLAGNLEALERSRPGITALIDGALPTGRRIEVSASAAGPPTMVVDGRFIASRRDPVAEAARIVARRFDAAPDIAVFLHFGFGYEIAAFIERFPETPVLLLEPDIELFRAALGGRDLRTLLASPNLSLLLETAPALLGTVLDDRRYEIIEFWPHAAVSRLHPDYLAQTREWFRRFESRREINRNTLRRFGRLWVRNLLRNMGDLGDVKPAAELENLLDGRPCLVLAAGPSLDDLRDEIDDLRQRMAVIAVDTAAAWCVRSELRPDFLVVVDPQYWNTRHLDIVDRPQVLVSESSTHPAVFRRLDGPRYFGSSLFPLGRYLERELGIAGTLGAGGSVATTAWDLARFMGAGAIYCAGLDLGYPGMKTHYRGSLFEELSHLWSKRTDPSMNQHYRVLRDGSPVIETAAAGGTVVSDRRLTLYRWWFENRFADPASPPTYTLSPGGVAIAGMRLASPADLIDLPPIRDELDDLLPGPDRTPSGPAELRRRREAAVEKASGELDDALRELGELCTEALECIDSSAATGEKLAALASVDRRIVACEAKDIAGFLIDTDNPAGDDPLESSRTVYSRIKDSVLYHRRLIAETLASPSGETR